MKTTKTKPEITDTKEEMPKHYSQKEANGMADEILSYRKAIDKFFDKYNDIRGQVEGLMDTEIETAKDLVVSLTDEGDKIAVDKVLAKLKVTSPEFESTWGEIMRHRGKLETLVIVSERLKGILIPKQENQDGDL